MPESVECLQGPEIALSPKLRFDILNSSTIASAAVDRYTPLLRPERTSIAQSSRVATLASVTISWSIASENLTSDTNYSYNLRCCTTDPNGGLNARVFAASVFGVGYALETLVQLADGNGSGGSTIPCGGGLSVVDYPVYRHRGLMVDTGRRYYPIALLHSTLDAMSAFKMNVLHFHLSEVKSVSTPHFHHPRQHHVMYARAFTFSLVGGKKHIHSSFPSPKSTPRNYCICARAFTFSLGRR